MSGLNHDWDRPYGPGHADFKHGAVDPDDFEKEVDYTPRRRKKGCKKSKDGSPCNFTIPVVTYSYRRKDEHVDWIEDSCERCGKRDWTSYRRVIRRIG